MSTTILPIRCHHALPATGRMGIRIDVPVSMRIQCVVTCAANQISPENGSTEPCLRFAHATAYVVWHHSPKARRNTWYLRRDACWRIRSAA